MPLIYKTEADSQKEKLGIWEICESVDFLLKRSNLSESEKIALQTIKNENRKKQWLVSRIILNEISGNNSLSIVYEENGRPLINDRSHHISISHTTKFVAVILNNSYKVGIDIESIHPRILKVRQKFLSSKEDVFPPNDKNLQEKLIIIWSAKEALFKYYGKGNLDFKKDIFIEPFDFNESGIIYGRIMRETQKIPLHYKKIEDHFLVYTTIAI